MEKTIKQTKLEAAFIVVGPKDPRTVRVRYVHENLRGNTLSLCVVRAKARRAEAVELKVREAHDFELPDDASIEGTILPPKDTKPVDGPNLVRWSGEGGERRDEKCGKCVVLMKSKKA